MKILDGKKLSKKILSNLKKKAKKKKLKLAVVLVGNDLSSEIYVQKKREACEKIGIGFKLYKFPLGINKPRLKKEVEKIGRKPENSGVVIQLPLPDGFEPQEFLNLVPPEKDIDILSETNIGKFYAGSLPVFPPPVEAIRRILKEYKISIKSKNIVLIGAGRLIGRPLALWLLKEEATISIAGSFTKDIAFLAKEADIIVSGVGAPNLITDKMIKRGAVIIDAGTFRKRGKLTGDFDFKKVSKKAGYITPVPGGIGPVTVACLLENLVKLN